MKISKLVLVFLMAAVACSKKDDSSPSLQNAKVTTTTVATPAGLTAAAKTDSHAQEVVTYLATANGMTDYTNLFKVPSGATKSSTAITAINARVAAVASTMETYVWSDPQYGSVALQISDDGTSYTWEYFYKATGSKDWFKFLNAQETKDGSNGHLEVLDYTGSDPKAVFYKFNWSLVKDQYTFQWTFTDFYYFILKENTTTKIGSIDFYDGTGVDSVLSAKYTWGADGHGTWQTFDSDGITPLDSGTW